MRDGREGEMGEEGEWEERGNKREGMGVAGDVSKMHAYRELHRIT